MKTPEQMGETESEEIEGTEKTIRINNDPEGINRVEMRRKEMLEKYKNDKRFKETIQELETIAKGAGFKGLIIKEWS